MLLSHKKVKSNNWNVLLRFSGIFNVRFLQNHEIIPGTQIQYSAAFPAQNKSLLTLLNNQLLCFDAAPNVYRPSASQSYINRENLTTEKRCPENGHENLCQNTKKSMKNCCRIDITIQCHQMWVHTMI